EKDACDIEVASLHQGFIRSIRASDGECLFDQRVVEINKTSDGWAVALSRGTIEAPVLVTAAGAWAEGLASQVGIVGPQLFPLRRTALLADVTGVPISNEWPFVIDIRESFYFKPDAGKLLISPADEEPTVASDVQADEWDVAVAVDRLEA